jgi:hypothetical protein
MKTLFITSNRCDNLEDGILHGFRMLYGADCVDFPRKDVLYASYQDRDPALCYGRLFTIWRTLPDISIDRMDIESRVKKGEFDLIIFGSIWRVQPWYRALLPFLNRRNTIILDGEDTGHIHRHAARRFIYFKRELLPKSSYYYNYKLIPPFLYNRAQLYPDTVQPIAFCIPEQKIRLSPMEKKTVLPLHIVDPEVKDYPAFRQSENALTHIFDQEADYYQNLSEARFGITTKRGGWDCLRHYEIAANGTLQCFKNLEEKPELCAPHGLIHGVNCISYSSADDLYDKINSLSDREYLSLMQGSNEWIRRQTSVYRVRELLEQFQQLVH